MILFTLENAYKIVTRQKTITSRFSRRRIKEGSFHYAQLNMSAASRFARLHILSVTEWNGKTCTEEFAKKEGFESSTEFLFAYWSLNDHQWDDPKRKHYAIEFEVVELYESDPPIKVETQEQLEIFDAIGSRYFDLGGANSEENRRREALKQKLETAGFIFEVHKNGTQKPYCLFVPYFRADNHLSLGDRTGIFEKHNYVGAYKRGYSAVRRAQRIMDNFISTYNHLSAEGKAAVDQYKASP